MGLSESIEVVLTNNSNFLIQIPFIRYLTVKFLIKANPIYLSDLRSIKTKYDNSFALKSELESVQFKKIMKRLLCYLGTGPIGPSKYWEYPWALANLRLETGLSILDAGCGASPIQFFLSDIGAKVVGVDPNENVSWHGINRKLCKRFGSRIKYRRAGIEELPFDDNTFDRVCCLSVIEHCRMAKSDNEKMTPQTRADRRLQYQMMKEMVRVLKPGGFLVITVDFNFPRDDCLLESNVDVANLLLVDNVEPWGKRCPEPFPCEKEFDSSLLIQNSDIDVVNYADTLQTSIGLTMQKTG